MNTLFVHQNFPAQFRYLAPALATVPHSQVVAMHINPTGAMPGVQLLRYQPKPRRETSAHPWLADLDVKVARGEAAYHAAMRLKGSGFNPDVIIAHPGWGESLFLKEVWPAARLGIYCEFYYHAKSADTGFDPEFAPAREDDACRLRMKNANYELHFPMAQGGLSPTLWQRSVFPEPFRSRITVMHDGIDTVRIAPNPQVRMTLGTRKGRIEICRDAEIITFVNRNLEPYRGFHIFMRALPAILRARPSARVLIVGGDGVSYGSLPSPRPCQPAAGSTGWRSVLLEEVREELDLERVHFLGNIPNSVFVQLLQVSTVHAYLTYPFVLSWSLLEAMSAGCAIVASDTTPVREAITHGQTGRLFDFFDVHRLAQEVISLCDDAAERQRLGAAARAFAQEHYDLHTRCLPGQLAWARHLMG